MATFASDFDKHSVPMPTWNTPTPTVPSSPGAQATALSSYNGVSGQTPVSQTSQGLQSIQSQMQMNAGLSGQIDPNLTQDAYAGNLAMAQRQQSQPSYGAPTPPAPTGPAMGGQSDALSKYLAQASAASAAYKPEAVQGVYGGKDNSYTLTRSGLREPDPRQFTSQADYQQALSAYNKLALNEEKIALSSDAQAYVNSQNSYQKMIDEMRRRTSMVEAAQNELTEAAKVKRADLANRLAARGISENTDSSAQQQFAELDRLNTEAQQAARTAAALDAKEFMTNEEYKMSQALKERIKEIGLEQDRIASIEAAETKNAQDLLAIEAKNRDYESKIADREFDNERQLRETMIKEMLGPAQYANLMAKTDYTGAQTDYLSGAKTDLTNAQIGKTEAQTNRINTLLPAELEKMQAMTAKLRLVKSGGGGGGGGSTSLTPEELEAVYRLNGGKAPTSDKAMAQLVNQVRTVNGNVDALVETQNQTAATKAAEVKKATNAVTSSGDSFKDAFMGL